MPYPFYANSQQIVSLQTIQFSRNTQFNYHHSFISVKYEYRYCLHTVKCQNSSILNSIKVSKFNLV